MPARDSRGRFVAWPTTPAPNWYVFCAAGYRIPGDSPPEPAAAPPPDELPTVRRVRVVRRSRPRMRRDEVVNWLVVLLFLLGMYWYAFSLPVPDR